jgi:hypothetical protein
MAQDGDEVVETSETSWLARIGQSFAGVLIGILGAGAGLVAFLCTIVVAPLVVAVAWFFYRPVVAAIVLVAAAGLAYGIIHLSRRRLAARKAAAAA